MVDTLNLKRPEIWIVCAITAGAGSVYLLPVSWVMPTFLAAIAATLLFGILARLGKKDDRPVNPALDIAMSLVGLPARPFQKIPPGPVLQCFLALAAFTISQAVVVVVRAYI